ncbi:SAC3/GANP/Nin1/mts3/eIF-3 p25 family-domain-containing protein [Flagelloscypha sp. PMI_526]|nr:SAC3/GANP/Nin1/mts3/eIF-3 p25 family-domain-containing protein [Flagelloscypha sp. PMI_526]
MSSESWPPKLKEWVAKCLGQMTDSNRTEAQTELRKVIADAFNAKTLWTTDWDRMELQSLRPRPPPQINSLKRKSIESPSTKKTKKSKNNNHHNNASNTDFVDESALNRRAARFQREHEIERQKTTGNPFKANHHTSHLFHNSRSTSPMIEDTADPNVMDWDRLTIVGTSTSLFKDYLRLTSEPRPDQIRPLSILQKTLPELTARWKKDGRSQYHWVCSQFKSIRQDLTVQRIKTEFTVNVYEVHARIALEMEDMIEYSTCTGTLRQLYELGIPGNKEEFTAYRLLEYLHGRNHRELNTLVGQLTPRQKKDEVVRHALQVQHALAAANYHKLFKLWDEAPKMSGYIMDQFMKSRERARALVIMSRSYMTLTISFITNELGFDDDSKTLEFLDSHGAAPFIQNPNDLRTISLDCKNAKVALAEAYEEKYKKMQIHGAV